MHAVTGKPAWSWRSFAAPGLHSTRSVVGPWHRWCLASLAALALLVQARGVWAADLLVIAGLLVLPGLLLLRALRVPGSAVAAFPVYVPAASLVVLLASGLLVDLIGPLLAVSQPLRAGPLLVGLELTCLGLLAAGWRAAPEVDIPWHWPAAPAWQLLVPLSLPLLAATGAERLNNAHGGALALAAVALCCVTLLGTIALAARLDKPVLSVVLYAVSLALTWGFSLRGDLVYGFDIASEYHALQQTIATGSWHTAHVGDAYGALLSVTVLPAELHAVAGVSGLLVFKALYPALLALFPVAVFHLAARVITKTWAFAGAALLVAQQPFFQQMPGLARQEIAFVLFAVLVAAILDAALPRRSQLVLVALLAAGVAVSHYSTTYFAIVMFAVAMALQLAVSWFREVPRVSPALAVGLVVVAAGAVVWYGLVTRSASNVSQLVSISKGQGLDLLPSGGDLLSRYLQAGNASAIPAAEYARQVHLYYAAHIPWVHPLPAAANPAYALKSAALPSTPARFRLGRSALSSAELLVEQILNVVAGVGALWLVLSRKGSALTRQIGLLGLGTLVVLVLLRFSGTAAAAYNPERALLQALVVLAAVLGWALQSLAGSGGRRQIAAFVIAIGAVAVLAANSMGLAGAAFGGGTDTNLANTGTDYAEFGTTAPELAAAGWLGRHAERGQPIYADRYATLRLLEMFGARSAMLSDVTPLTISSQGWVYADRTNVVDGVGMAYFQNQTSSYAFPMGYLRANYDLVYTDGTAEVYSR